MLANLGNKGSMSEINGPYGYWDAATLFELYFLTRKLQRACRAAFVMQAMPSEPWMFTSTLSNVEIIQSQAKDVQLHDECYAVFQFWFWYFETSSQTPPDATKEHSATDKASLLPRANLGLERNLACTFRGVACQPWPRAQLGLYFTVLHRASPVLYCTSLCFTVLTVPHCASSASL